MVFSSFIFLYGFLPLFLAAYYLAPARARNGVALIGSLLFYAWGEPTFVLVLVGSSSLVYVLSRALERFPAEAVAWRRLLAGLAITSSLGVLAYCKYANFFVDQLNALLLWREHEAWLWTEVILPIGVSFYTFQQVSYVVDVCRGTARPARSIFDFLLFVALFPQLIAGPIIRYQDIAAQIVSRRHTIDRFLSGLWRFCLGLGRKVLIANPLGEVADTVFAQEAGTLAQPYAWLGLLAYTFQIYFDFAGYSDMAIGLGRMIGFEFVENFNRPYTARSITGFWRRWHLSLSTFMRDYLYIPLGGNRVPAWRRGLNLWFVFLVSGFWHGASWNFVIWGAYHGTFLTLEKAVGPAREGRWPTALRTAATFLVVMLGWVFFRSPDLTYSLQFFSRLVAWESWATLTANLQLLPPDVISRRSAAVLVVAAVISFIPDHVWQRHGWDDALPRSSGQARLRGAIGALCLLLATAALAGQSYNPFIYFRF